MQPDSGEVAIRKGTKLSCVSQISEFDPNATVRSVIEAALAKSGVPETDRGYRTEEALHRAGFEDPEIVTVGALRRMAQASRDCRSVGAAAGYSAAR